MDLSSVRGKRNVATDVATIYSQPSKCPYNPYISKFEWDERYLPVEAYGNYTHTGFIIDHKRISELNNKLWG